MLRCALVSPRRFSLVPLIFFALWVLWFLLPSTREIACKQWKARLISAPDAASATAKDASRDAAFALALSERGLSSGDNDDPRRRALEELGRRYPGDADICAAQIVATANELHLGNLRRPGPSSSADPNWSVKLPYGPLQTPSPELLKSWFAATARGAKLEPNNTFWDWAQIIGLLAARRDEEIWPVLRAASGKTGYDDHISDGALARIRSARQRRTVLPVQ